MDGMGGGGYTWGAGGGCWKSISHLLFNFRQMGCEIRGLEVSVRPLSMSSTRRPGSRPPRPLLIKVPD